METNTKQVTRDNLVTPGSRPVKRGFVPFIMCGILFEELKKRRGFEWAKYGQVSRDKQIESARLLVQRVLFDAPANKGNGKGEKTGLYKALDDFFAKNRGCIIVAPTIQSTDPHNILPITFAHELFKEFGSKYGVTVSKDIHQIRQEKKKREMDSAERITFNTKFHGRVIEGKNYFLVDDTFVTGGCMASLKAFIEVMGGTVTGAAALADGGQTPQPKDISKAGWKYKTFKGVIYAPFIANQNELKNLNDLFQRIKVSVSKVFGEAHGTREKTTREVHIACSLALQRRSVQSPHEQRHVVGL